ncbi:MAG TPA: hypothetical protein VM662_10105 [Sphingomonas sp.]|nr:hypothetical protein [Sphingomonas sp.]
MQNDQDDRAYFAQRAREERERANVCEDNAVALVHIKMADAYDRRAEQATEAGD